MRKRGISGIIVTVLIVLLALAGISLVWGLAIRPSLDRATETGIIQQECFATELNAKNCIVTETGLTYQVVANVELKKGDPSKIIVTALTSNGGSLQSVEADPPSSIFATTSVTFNGITDEQFPLKIRANPFVTTSYGESICSEQYYEVICDNAPTVINTPQGQTPIPPSGGGGSPSGGGGNSPGGGNPPSQPVCGNGIVETGEDCEPGDAWPQAACDAFTGGTHPEGLPTCNSSCQIDLSSCSVSEPRSFCQPPPPPGFGAETCQATMITAFYPNALPTSQCTSDFECDAGIPEPTTE